MKKGLTMGALVAAVMLTAGCSSSGGAPEKQGQNQGTPQPGSSQTSMGNDQTGSEVPTGTGNGGSVGTSPGGGIDSNNHTKPGNTQSGSM